MFTSSDCAGVTSRGIVGDIDTIPLAMQQVSGAVERTHLAFFYSYCYAGREGEAKAAPHAQS